MRKVLISVLILLVIGQSAGLYFVYDRWQQAEGAYDTLKKQSSNREDAIKEIQENSILTEYEQMQQITLQEKETRDIAVSGWIPDWDYEDGKQTFIEQVDSFSSISPFWYKLNEDGTLQPNQHTGDGELITVAQENNVEIIPTITSFDPLELRNIITDDIIRDNHVDSIISEIQQNNYDGIDLDYEATYLADKQDFFLFLANLSEKMQQIDKTLIFTALPKWGDEVVYSGLAETRMVQDYQRIASLVDYLRIMAYEYTGRSSTNYGPVAPLSWLEDIVRYAILEGVPREKLILSVHTYSYNYASNQALEKINYYPVLRTQTESDTDTLAYYNQQVEALKQRIDFTEEYNAEWGEMVLKYETEDEEERTVIYPTQESYEDRKQIAADFGIHGVAIWRLGDEVGGFEY